MKTKTPNTAAATFRGRLNLGEDKMPTGKIKWYNSQKGYGFVAPDDGGKDVFVHVSAVERAGLRELSDDQAISYDLEDGRDGRQAATNLELK